MYVQPSGKSSYQIAISSVFNVLPDIPYLKAWGNFFIVEFLYNVRPWHKDKYKLNISEPTYVVNKTIFINIIFCDVLLVWFCLMYFENLDFFLNKNELNEYWCNRYLYTSLWGRWYIWTLWIYTFRHFENQIFSVVNILSIYGVGRGIQG